MPCSSISASRSPTSHDETSMLAKGWTTWAPRTFSRPVEIVLPPVLAQIWSWRYRAVTPSIVFWTGTRSLIDAGTREVHRSAGSVRCASHSMIRMSSSRSEPVDLSTDGRVAVILLSSFDVVLLAESEGEAVRVGRGRDHGHAHPHHGRPVDQADDADALRELCDADVVG